ncbi:MAG: hypothetical protein IK066_08990 [Kiritimatiellae bacterium]|nr:hypothetical protein [Kiritimatiellia bacterium]
MGKSRSKDAAMQAAALTILAAAVVGIINLLFLSKGGFAKFIRPIVWTILLAAGLWYLRERTRPEFYECEACGLEYTCEDEKGREPNGYCEKTASHKHHGSVVGRYDFARGAKYAVIWTLGGAEHAREVLAPDGKGPGTMAGTKNND